MAHTHTNTRGKTYHLHANRKPNASGGETVLHYFSGTLNPAKAVDAVPAGHKVVESARTGLPMLKRIA